MHVALFYHTLPLFGVTPPAQSIPYPCPPSPLLSPRSASSLPFPHSTWLSPCSPIRSRSRSVLPLGGITEQLEHFLRKTSRRGSVHSPVHPSASIYSTLVYSVYNYLNLIYLTFLYSFWSNSKSIYSTLVYSIQSSTWSTHLLGPFIYSVNSSTRSTHLLG